MSVVESRMSTRGQVRGIDRGEDAERVGVEVVDGEVGLAARVAAADALELPLVGLAVAGLEDVLAQLAARVAQAHALADVDEQAGDLLVAEHEAATAPDALVALEQVVAVRAGPARVGVRARSAAGPHRERERRGPVVPGMTQR